MDTKSEAPRRAGRPDAQAAEALNRHILSTATRLFVEQGYAATSIEQIAIAAGAGKTTIYRRHSSKEELFMAVVSDLIGVIVESAVAANKENANPLAALRDLCKATLEFIARPEVIAVYRVLIAEAPRFPKLIDRVMRDATGPSDIAIRRLLRAAQQSGGIRQDYPVEEMLRVVRGMTTGWLVQQNLLGLGGLVGEDERTRFFDTSWAVFLSGVTPP